MTRGLTQIFAYACAAATVLVAQDAPQQPTFRSKTAGVMVDVTVRDANRRAVTGLTAKDFTLLDNEVAQQIDDVSYGKLPIDITVALDVSHSVSGGLLERLRQAVTQLMTDLGKDDRLKLVLFNMRVARTIDYTRDVRAVERAIRTASAGGGTSLIDALSVTLVSESVTGRRQLVVFFTDGSDSTSTTSQEMVVTVAQRTRGTLAFVVPSTGVSSVTSEGTDLSLSAAVSRIPNYPLLLSLARETGGTILPVGGSANLSNAFKNVLNEFRSSYVLYYTPRGVDRAGYHRLTVHVKRNGARVEARRGYFSS
jgi:VWFA-related protein